MAAARFDSPSLKNRILAAHGVVFKKIKVVQRNLNLALETTTQNFFNQHTCPGLLATAIVYPGSSSEQVRLKALISWINEHPELNLNNTPVALSIGTFQNLIDGSPLTVIKENTTTLAHVIANYASPTQLTLLQPLFPRMSSIQPELNQSLNTTFYKVAHCLCDTQSVYDTLDSRPPVLEFTKYVLKALALFHAGAILDPNALDSWNQVSEYLPAKTPRQMFQESRFEYSLAEPYRSQYTQLLQYLGVSPATEQFFFQQRRSPELTSYIAPPPPAYSKEDPHPLRSAQNTHPPKTNSFLEDVQANSIRKNSPSKGGCCGCMIS